MPVSPGSEELLGYSVYSLSANCCVSEIVSEISSKHRRWLACINPHSYVVARGRPRFKEALRAATWLVPDGVGIVIASAVLGGEIRRRITGFDVFSGVHDSLQSAGSGTVFFLGSSSETLDRIRLRMAVDWPDVKVVGVFSPPFKERFSNDDVDEMLRRINAVRPQVLWVGLTAPKQEELIFHLIERLDVGFVGAIGAVFDFYSGKVRRSPELFHKVGLEWLPRLVQEPKRLWRRMAISAPIFLWDTARARVDVWRRRRS